MFGYDIRDKSWSRREIAKKHKKILVSRMTKEFELRAAFVDATRPQLGKNVGKLDVCKGHPRQKPKTKAVIRLR